MTHTHLRIIVGFAVIALAPGAASASEVFPPVLVDAWGLERLPAFSGADGCLLCHSTAAGVTVTKPFGRSLDAAGTAKRNLNSFVQALNALRSNKVDSDEDGISDYQELAVDGTDPNDGDDFKPEPEPGNGGAAGAGGAGESIPEGGRGGDGEPAEPPDFVLPEFPPLPEHGCSFHGSVTRSPYMGLFACVLISAALRRHRRSGSRPRIAIHP